MKMVLTRPDRCIQYNGIEFDENITKSARIKAFATTDCILLIRLDHANGVIVGEINIAASADWNIILAPLKPVSTGKYNLIIQLKKQAKVEIDWIDFV